ncbi:MAG: excinuclease ABC subunit UvrA [Opitutales bacterium]|nr:excinuclease ABC subunit UvrA [Opitutales bacterium]MDP4644462.1 excinuclease ABC subunit UvrA [Opitutales bacterium]MDP4777284.1 excinuclease ABC subunit UvrA [Opitutales bacterium]MDP4883507.1 excinuclease ABC subunit UvrA [Opitutales bacterium]MDP5080008.1 excinuclease ABC subunit UvrA [Opitutales bacterium]
MPKSKECIRLRGVRQNNLKGFDLDLPIGQLTVVTGLSGAGKSSLVFETLHAEGQRRYVETFSPYTRQFMDLLDRPKVDSVENIRPSIAIHQSNTVKTSRSTVGTITELADYFKVWFANVATLYDPVTGEPITDDNPQSAWKKLSKDHKGQTVLITFPVTKPEKLSWDEILQSISAQGYSRVVVGNKVTRISDLNSPLPTLHSPLLVVQDRIARLGDKARSRSLEALQTAFQFGHGHIHILDTDAKPVTEFIHGLTSPETGQTFRPAAPSLFSFNSPIGACAECRGFGRVIEIDYNLVIPDRSKSLDDGAIRAFQGEVYSESLRDLQRAAKKHKVRTHIPFSKLNKKELAFVMDGDPSYKPDASKWYGVRRFFDWLNGNLYKMHVRVFLSKFRSYTKCPKCNGARLKPESLNWKWQGRTLPELYQKSVGDLLDLLGRDACNKRTAEDSSPYHNDDTALAGILSRLSFLNAVGLSYLTLDRTSRTLSGGETMRVNLTSCLGSSLVDTLFVLDEPSVGLHPRDMDRLIGILRRLTDLGNTVVVVEHDEAVMRAADNLIEIGPRPGINGGQLTFHGSYKQILKSDTHTGRYLSGRDDIETPETRRAPTQSKTLSVFAATKHNLSDLTVHIPQQSFVCLSGVSGSGKSTLLNNVIYQNLLAQKGLTVEDPAVIKDIESTLPLSDVVLIDQSPVSKTPRSNPASYSKAWDEIRKLFSQLEAAASAGMGPGHFSFNSGDGRCATCSGLGFERIEMQFVSDVFVPCETCEGQRFKAEVLEIDFNGRTIADILELDIDEALLFFGEYPKITRCLQPMIDVGLGYLKLGQPLNTLSGGESQRLKLVSYLSRIPNKGSQITKHGSHSLILIDEPTTGLHRADVKRLIGVLQSLVEAGNSLIVIEHNLDILKVADWIVELGPEAGAAGGQIIAEGTPEQIAETDCVTATYLREALGGTTSVSSAELQVAEQQTPYSKRPTADSGILSIKGAREHNLKNVSCEIAHNKMTVITGVSGSGKSSLAFDIIFAEGQRRFMESMSAYARQFVEQMPRADVDELHGIAPTVAIEQRVTKGTRKSSVATITEVAQYLRLLYARIGIQHSPTSGEAVVSQSEAALQKRLKNILAEHAKPQNLKTSKHKNLLLCAPIIRGRKGHHEPLANWARDHGYEMLRIDGTIVHLDNFKKLDRYKEHDIDLVITPLSINHQSLVISQSLKEALRLGKGSAFILTPKGEVVSWLSTKRTDPTTGEAFPELDPKHFSWNSPRGWCPTCRGYGQLFEWMANDEENPLQDHIDDFEDGEACPDCQGARLNPLSRAVRLPLKSKMEGRAPSRPPEPASGNDRALPSNAVSLPELLCLTPSQLLKTLKRIKADKRSKAVLDELLPEIEERMRFMDRVGLDYLQLDRATATLSGGEAQRIRLAAQLGSNLSGVLYVLDEPSIGLHARDNEKLIASMEQLRNRGNTLIVVEHNEATMRKADQIIDLGPAAGVHGGEIVASGKISQIKKSKRSLTGKYLRKAMTHPLRGNHRELPTAWSPRKKKGNENWIALQCASLRNLKGFDVQIPKQRLTAVCGVSGAGKSTLICDLLKPLVETAIEKKSAELSPKELPTPHSSLSTTFRALSGAETVRKVIEVDQSPIGKTPRSTPATYIGAFDIIRDIFAKLPEANVRGYKAGTFSFNTKGGRCETCKGAGRVKLEMNFMPDTYVTCEDCNGRRYGAELDELRWNGKSIADVLKMSFEKAAEFFSFHTQLSSLMQLMVETGLGYIELGQYSPTLSGGEAQRLKLVSELAKGQPTFKERQYNKGQGNLYILEEPTIGLHLSDVERLIELLHRLVDKGHTVIVIEHHLEVIKDADYVVEIGPHGGDAGGELLYQGNVEGLKKAKGSVTAKFL